ncbi:MAG: hypothetical protein II830_01070 [Alphaproteobacteria bacterium]|nr:hypothetical protein [Alphaproteobacteria bacterium]
MKKIVLVGISVLLLASCIAKPKEDTEVMQNKQSGSLQEMLKQQDAQGQEKQAAQVQKPERVMDIADSDLEMYRRNIVVKTMGEDYIVYEYSNVRIDKVAPLASRFCYETNPGKKAYLRDIYMHKNHKRRATFDCVDLASE